MDKREKKGIAIGAAIGAVAGVVTGILFAPKAGKETRAELKNAAGNVTEKIEQEVKKLQSEAKDIIKKVEAKAKTVGGKIGASAKKQVDTVKHLADSLTAVVKAFKSGKATDKDLNQAISKLNDAKESLKNFLKK